MTLLLYVKFYFDNLKSSFSFRVQLKFSLRFEYYFVNEFIEFVFKKIYVYLEFISRFCMSFEKATYP